MDDLVSKDDNDFLFSLVQMDCQTEISRGAGIQPKKAIKNEIPIVFLGITGFKEREVWGDKAESIKALTVLIVNTIMMHFIILSSSLNFPIVKIVPLNKRIINVHV